MQIVKWLFGSTPSVEGIAEPSDHNIDIYRQGLDQLTELGYAAVEIPHVGHLTLKEASALGEYIRQSGLFVSSVHADVCRTHDEADLNTYRHLHTINVHNTAAIGAKILVEHAIPSSEPDDIERERDRFGTSITMASSCGLITAIENGGDNYQLVWEIVQSFDSDQAGVCLDIGHANLGTVSIPKIIECFSDRLIHVHAHDNMGAFDAHRPLGQGSVDWDEAFKELAGCNYQGAIIFEVASPYARANAPESVNKKSTVLDDLIQSIKYYRKVALSYEVQ